MADIPGLLSSIQGFTAKVKTAIALGDEASMAEVNRLIEELSGQIDLETVELGAAAGGDFGVAITERYIDLAAGSQIDCGAGNHFGKVITGVTAFTVTNIPLAGRVCTFSLRLTNPGAAAISFWSGVKWSEGVAPTWSATGRDIVAFSTVDGGVTWDAYLLGKDMKAAV